MTLMVLLNPFLKISSFLENYKKIKFKVKKEQNKDNLPIAYK